MNEGTLVHAEGFYLHKKVFNIWWQLIYGTLSLQQWEVWLWRKIEILRPKILQLDIDKKRETVFWAEEGRFRFSLSVPLRSAG